MSSIIELKNLTKIYREDGNEVVAVDNVNLQIQKGEFTAIVGPSGSGKTTLLNLLGGIDKPTSGQIIVDGTDITRLSFSQLVDFRLHNIGFVFQSYNLIPVLTAKENVEFVMFLQNRPQSEREKRSTELLTAIGLAERMNSRPSKLSGGQQQRVAVARALAPRPKFVLADEPTANLDSRSAENLLEIMEMLNRNENITFIFSTHDPRVMRKARRIVTLLDGHIDNDTVTG
ncbi:MAG: ABC transporter ATP-binding protein [Bacteroidales bacterium]|nr:ABC transporter ATP-binding protein [Bacteroidales bacterium]